jgi:hypothetical protein
MPAVAERLRRAYPTLTERAGVGSIPANPDARNVPSFRRWRLEMKLSPLFLSTNKHCSKTERHQIFVNARCESLEGIFYLN